MIVGKILNVLTIVGIIYLYVKYKTDNEEYFALKLIGYFLLGVFTFYFNGIAIPLGFIVFILAFKPSKNVVAKKASAYLGLFNFIVDGVLSLLH